MSVQETNKDIVRRLVETGVAEEDFDIIREIVADDYVRHDDSGLYESEGPEAFNEIQEAIGEGFPDFELEVGEMIAEGDLVAFQGTMTGTHDGSFMGVEPTGRSISIRGNAMHRVVDGKVVETWATWDTLGLMQQLEAVETPTP